MAKAASGGLETSTKGSIWQSLTMLGGGGALAGWRCWQALESKDGKELAKH